MEQVMKRKGEYIIPREAIPEVMSRITVSPEDKVVCLERTEPMFTTYWASAGEISPFFLAVMKEKKIIGARCPKCKMVICPPYMTRCPVCQKEDKSLVDLELGIELPQVGYLLGTPPITVFANARFARYAPFGRGRVILGESQSALPAISPSFWISAPKNDLVPIIILKPLKSGGLCEPVIWMPPSVLRCQTA